MVGPRSVCGDNGSIEKDIRGVEMIEDEASVRKVGERESAEADQLKSVELGLAMAKGGEKGLELLEMVEVIAFCKYCQDVLVKVQLALNRVHRSLIVIGVRFHCYLLLPYLF